MKKSLFISLVTAAALVLSVTSCNNMINEATNNLQVEENEGSVTASMFIPDYYALANNSRLILPATAKIKFSYYGASGWVAHSTVSLSTLTKTPVTGAPDGFPGSVYTVKFTKIPSATYASGKLKVELLDESDNVLSSATNTTSVAIYTGDTTSVNFHTSVADTSKNASGSLAKAAMKFYEFEVLKGKTYSVKINVGANDTYPDVVVLDKDWKIEKYYPVDSAAESTVTFPKETKNGKKLIAVWADDGAAISSYELVVSSTGTPDDLINVSDFNTKKGFGTGAEIDSSWTVTAKVAEATPKLETVTGDKDGDNKALVIDLSNLASEDVVIERDIILEQDQRITFAVKTDVSISFNGVGFYLDGTKKVLNQGEGDWTVCTFEVSAGKHSIKWVIYKYSSSSGSNKVYIDDLKFIEPIAYPASLNETFDKSLNADFWTSSGIVSQVVNEDELLKSWVQYGDALVDAHGKCYKIACHDSSTNKNGTSRLQVTIKPTVESALSIDYKMDMYSNNTFKVLIDDQEKTSLKGSDYTTWDGWKKATYIVSPGRHTIKFEVGSYGNNNKKCAVYIDNVTLVPNTVASVSISPKGLQETYVGGFNIPFTAKALRSDGTEITGKTVTWTGAADGVFAPSTAGTYTVTATIDGKSASNTTVKVHSADYLTEPVTIAGKTFTGTITNGSGTRPSTTNCTFTSPTPNYSSFSADGFFVLKGTTTKNLYVKISKGDYVTYYFIKQGTFTNRIWLRFGSGNYTITINESNFTYVDTGSEYEGDKSTGSYTLYTGAQMCQFTVNNVNSEYSAEEASFLMPSYWCQLDDFRITNAVNSVIAELPPTASVGQKLAALHDWEIHRMHYDYVSFNGARKAQDALHVYEYGMGVCEGYANLYAALARLIGVQSTVICADYNNHAWNNILYKNEWLLLDATWDDPASSSSNSNVAKNPDAENYTYFLLTKAQDSATSRNHGSKAIYATGTAATKVGAEGVNNMRAIDQKNATSSYVPYVRGLPDGWY